ncbi:MAG: DUF134 domain-containing protein [Desulfitobacteriia bacterium]|jgi:predicted DNA-binding protein (UPF0251 family)
MPRPIKRRLVCDLPHYDLYAPVNKENHGDEVVMLIEEFETIRLIDHEGLDQEGCAERMGVARSTIQRIYNEARKKVAESLVEGKRLRIEGGNYALCTKGNGFRWCGECKRQRRGRRLNRD